MGADQAPKPFYPRVATGTNRGSKAGTFMLVPYEYIAKTLHRPYRNLSGRIYDVPALKEQLARLRGVWIPKTRWNIYLELLNAIEKLVHQLRAVTTEADLSALAASGLWRDFQKDLQKLKEELKAYFTPEHPEYRFAEAFFDIEARLKDELRTMSWVGTVQDREKDCNRRKEKSQCASTRDCVWLPSGALSFKASCQYRPRQRNQPLDTGKLLHRPSEERLDQ